MSVASLQVPSRQDFTSKFDLEAIALGSADATIGLRQGVGHDIVQIGFRDIVLLGMEHRQRRIQALVEERALNASLVVLAFDGIQILPLAS